MLTQEKILKFFSFGLNEKTDPQIQTRILLTNIFSSLGIAFFIGFAVTALLNQLYWLSLILFTTSLLTILNILYLVRTQRIGHAIGFLLLLMAVFAPDHSHTRGNQRNGPFMEFDIPCYCIDPAWN